MTDVSRCTIGFALTVLGGSLATCTILGATAGLVTVKIAPAIIKTALSTCGYSKPESTEKTEPSLAKKCLKFAGYITATGVGAVIGFGTFIKALGLKAETKTEFTGNFIFLTLGGAMTTCALAGAATGLVAVKVAPSIVNVAASAFSYSKPESAEKTEPSLAKKCLKFTAYATAASVGAVIGFKTFANAIIQKI